MRLRGADWNDAIDMASERGESVAFTAAYGGNMSELAKLLLDVEIEKHIKNISLPNEFMTLIRVDKNRLGDIHYKNQVLDGYCSTCEDCLSNEREEISVKEIAILLTNMSDFIQNHIREKEWITTKDNDSWYNGYYDNRGLAVEGPVVEGQTVGATKEIIGESIKQNNRIMLTSQVFTIMSMTASDEQVEKIVHSVDKYLYDTKVGGYRLNSDFKELKLDMGRVFGFAYGHKENGAVFCHMAIMYANALYKRNFVKEGYKVINTLYKHCSDFETSRIYPGIPEYMNQKGRGMYHYLTGAASWLMLTCLTQMYGIKGEYGNLCIEPKILLEQFDQNNQICI